MSLPYVNLPDYFIQLLKSNMHHGENGYKKFKEQIWQERSFQYLVQKCFKDFGPDIGIDRLLTSMGWHGLRNRLASIFIYYSHYGRFPTGPQLELIDDVLKIEDKLAPYTIDGFSRGFLFGFYLKLGFLQLKEIWPNRKFDDFNFNEADLAMLKFTRTKIIKIDWLIIMLKYLTEFIGQEELQKKLEAGASYKSVYSLLDDEQKSKMGRGLLSYGASINEMEMFTDISVP